jgi:serine-type D-Ala-D-Ala carboxypeptidase (penicillin-binding protein 5/6)
MASLTKIMTAIVALEHQKTDDQYVVRQQSLVGEDSMGLSAGETLSLSDLLYGLILHSGNDAAETIADNFPNGRLAFIRAMNTKLATLGLTDTHFSNPTGLEGDGNQYTTARDLLTMTRYALIHFPEFRSVVATFDDTIPATTSHKAYYLENETNLISSYPGVEGVKTGYTPEAGLCLVTYLNYDGQEIIGVILHSDDRRDDMKELLDYSLTKLGIMPPHHG